MSDYDNLHNYFVKNGYEYLGQINHPSHEKRIMDKIKEVSSIIETKTASDNTIIFYFDKFFFISTKQ